MPIRYYLQENAIASNPNDLKARVLAYGSLEHEDIIQAMLKMGSTITEADIRAVLTAFYDTVANKVTEGYNVNLPIANLSCGITGVFNSPADCFDPARHKTKVLVLPGKMLKQLAEECTFEKTTRSERKPQLLQFNDVVSGNLNNSITPGGIAELSGLFLDFNPVNSAEGLFFMAANGDRYKVMHFSHRAGKRLVFQIPEIPAGIYCLELIKEFGTSQIRLRKGILEHD